jgi:hypothetical protein
MMIRGFGGEAPDLVRKNARCVGICVRETCGFPESVSCFGVSGYYDKI